MIKYNNNDLKSRFITDSTGAAKEVKSVYVGSNKVWGSSVAPFFVKWIDNQESSGEIDGSGELNGENFGKQGIARIVEIGVLCTSIANATFAPRSYYTPPLRDITISSSVVNIGEKIFSSCPNLEHITVDNNNTIYDSRNNCNAIIETSTNKLIEGCKTTIIPNSVTSIGKRALSGISGLTSVTIPDSVTSIGERAFSSCSSLTNVIIGKGVSNMSVNAFTSCNNLKNVTALPVVPPSATSPFSGSNNIANIYVPAESVDAYKSASGWSDYADIIQAIQ